jgi:hypothetical protein
VEVVFSFLLIEFHPKVEKRFPCPEGAKSREEIRIVRGAFHFRSAALEVGGNQMLEAGGSLHLRIEAINLFCGAAAITQLTQQTQ